MFSRKDENGRKSVSDDRVQTNSISRRLPRNDYRPCDYEILPRFTDLKAELDLYLEKLFAGEIDAGNGNVLDELICDVAREARRYLTKQHTSHIDLIQGLKQDREGNRMQFEMELDNAKADLERCIIAYKNALEMEKEEA